MKPTSRLLSRAVARPRLTPDGFEPGEIVSRRAVDDLSARFASSSYDADARTVEAVFSAGSRVARWGVQEELAITPAAIDMTRVALGQVRLLDTHNQNSVNAVLGVVEDARIEGTNLVGRIRFADTEAGRNAEGMVARGDLTGISVGYRVTQWSLVSFGDEPEVWRADKWELLEVSLVAVPADPQASIRSTPVSTQRADSGLSEKDDPMRRNAANPTEPNPPPADATRSAAPTSAPAPDLTRAAPGTDATHQIAAERTRAADIMSLGTRAAMPADAINAAVADGTSIEVFRMRAFDAMATAADRTRTAPSVTIVRDETDTRMAHLSDALTFRMGGASALRDDAGQVRAISAEARAYVGHSLAEMAAVVLDARSMPRDAAQREDVLRRAMHTTSDFPVIFESTINRVLAARYAAAEQTYRRISVQRNFRDFRPHDQLRVGDFPTLQPVGESGEIKFGTFGENKETVAVAPYAIQFAISRRMLVDDNIGAIDQVLGSYGDGVSRFEEATFYAMKALASGKGPTLREGNTTVFAAARGNLAAAGTAITTDALSAGRSAMRKVKNMSGALLNITPRVLLVGADKETEAEKAVAVITPTDAGTVNPFSKKFDIVVGPQEGNSWELYADPAVLPVFVWGMLDGYGAPRLRLDNPFGTQGVGISLEHDFGVGAIDWRGAYRNPGN